jgi:hypothetical protein
LSSVVVASCASLPKDYGEAESWRLAGRSQRWPIEGVGSQIRAEIETESLNGTIARKRRCVAARVKAIPNFFPIKIGEQLGEGIPQRGRFDVPEWQDAAGCQNWLLALEEPFVDIRRPKRETDRPDRK